MTDTTPPTSAADRWTFTFYSLAAGTSLVGQVWAGANHITADLPYAAKCALITIPVVVIEVFGVAMAARADMRMRAGLPGLRYLVLSAAAAGFAVALNFFGHRTADGGPSWWSWLFASIGLGAYVVWLFHSADRRNDAAQDRAHRAGASPDYGMWRWLRDPVRTKLAKQLAQEHGYGLFESLRAADDHTDTARRRKLIGRALRDIIRAEHDDKLMADLAEVSVDIDRLAVDIEAGVDYDGLSSRITRAMNPKTPTKLTTPKPAVSRELKPSGKGDGGPKKPGPKTGGDKPVREPSTGERIGAYIKRYPAKTTAEVAAKFSVSERTVQRHMAPIFVDSVATEVDVPRHVNGHNIFAEQPA